jgi:UDP-N-acetylglucosamine acyltransferase
MSAIDSTARVAPGATIGVGATVGPYCVIGRDVSVGEGCRLIAHVHVAGHTTIGARTVVYPFASLGTPPQSVKYRGGPTRLAVGADCDIRENVTLNIGTEDDRGLTEIGNHCFLMAGSHVGHDCSIGNHVTLANSAMLGGHVSLGDYAFLGGHVAVHQFVRVGQGAMEAGMSALRADLIPWGFAQGPVAKLVGINLVGLRRRGYAKADIHRLRQAYRELFAGHGLFRDRLARVEETYPGDPLIGSILAFIRGGTRPLITETARIGKDTGEDA